MRNIAQLSGCLIVASLFMGCQGSIRAYPATSIYAADAYRYELVPADIQEQPYVMYEGVPTYYVDGRWYRHTPHGWGYYRNEPAPLVGRRPYVQGAPPAYRAPSRPQQAPPSERGPRREAPQEAPPAYRR